LYHIRDTYSDMFSITKEGRKAEYTLKIREKWLKMILAREKTWEIRGNDTEKRGWIHLAQVGHPGIIHGHVQIVSTRKLTPNQLTWGALVSPLARKMREG